MAQLILNQIKHDWSHKIYIAVYMCNFFLRPLFKDHHR
jgi:hypothetical protein